MHAVVCTHTPAQTHTNRRAGAVCKQKHLDQTENLILTTYSMVPLGLWKEIRRTSFSVFFFCPVSESKRGVERVTLVMVLLSLLILSAPYTDCFPPTPCVCSSVSTSHGGSERERVRERVCSPVGSCGSGFTMCPVYCDISTGSQWSEAVKPWWCFGERL